MEIDAVLHIIGKKHNNGFIQFSLSIPMFLMINYRFNNEMWYWHNVYSIYIAFFDKHRT